MHLPAWTAETTGLLFGAGISLLSLLGLTSDLWMLPSGESGRERWLERHGCSVPTKHASLGRLLSASLLFSGVVFIVLGALAAVTVGLTAQLLLLIALFSLMAGNLITIAVACAAVSTHVTSRAAVAMKLLRIYVRGEARTDAPTGVLDRLCHEPTPVPAAPLPVEFPFNSRAFYKVLAAGGGFLCGSGILAGAIGGYSWQSTFKAAILFPRVFVPLFWLIACRSIHRSYLVSSDGVTPRWRGRDLEHVPWEEIADVTPWPVSLITRSGRKIPFQLMRAEMEAAAPVVVHAFQEQNARNPAGK